MSDFDMYIKNKAAKEQTDIPYSVKNRIEQTLADLPDMLEPERKYVVKRVCVIRRTVAVAVCIVFIMLFMLPNISVEYAKAIEPIPVIGDIVKVITIRNYFYEDDRHNMDIDVPQIKGDDSEAADYINKDVSELTRELVNQFYKDLEINGNKGYGSIYVDYEAVLNTRRWFTLKLSVCETAASSNNYYKFYHIDKEQGKIVELGDLFATADIQIFLQKTLSDRCRSRWKQMPIYHTG